MFSFIINFCEAFGISVIVSPSVNKNKVYILFLSIIVTFLSTYYNYENMTYILILEVIIVSLLTAFVFLNRIKVKIVSQVLLSILINSFCNLLALLVMSGARSISILHIRESSQLFMQATVLSKIIFLGIASLIYLNNFTFNEGKVHTMISLLLADTIVIVHGLIDAIIYEMVTIRMIYLLATAFILLVVCLIMIIYFTNNEYENNMKLQRYQTQEKMVKNNIILLESISSKMIDMEHKMNYLLINIKYLAIKNKNDEIINTIEKNLWKINKTNHFINTKNPYFDNLFAGVIKKMHLKNISPIIVCEVKKGELDNNIYMTSLFVELIEQIATFVNESSDINITIRSTPNGIIFSLIVMGIDISFKDKICIDYKELRENGVYYSANPRSDNSIEFKFIFFEVNP